MRKTARRQAGRTSASPVGVDFHVKVTPDQLLQIVQLLAVSCGALCLVIMLCVVELLRNEEK